MKIGLAKKIRQNVSNWLRRRIVPLMIVGVVALAGFVLLFNRIVVVIPAGNVGVIYRPLSDGIDFRRVYREGVNLKLPWNSVTQYSTRVNSETLELTLLTADLLETQVTVVFQYEINRLTAPLLHQYAGADFLKKIIVPQVISAAREMVAKHSSKEAFTDEIQIVIKRIAIVADDSIVDQLSPPGRTNVKLVNISAVQLISVSYPEEVRNAIRQKMVAAQSADAFKYNISIAEQEAQRKVIEAQGIKNFQDIAFGGVITDYLRYRGIEASEALAKSDNAKVLLFGSGASGLPLVLDTADTNSTKTAK
ncbi:MAG: prohibitin family protein [Alcaligenaceae bacterium]